MGDLSDHYRSRSPTERATASPIKSEYRRFHDKYYTTRCSMLVDMKLAMPPAREDLDDGSHLKTPKELMKEFSKPCSQERLVLYMILLYRSVEDHDEVRDLRPTSVVMDFPLLQGHAIKMMTYATWWALNALGLHDLQTILRDLNPPLLGMSDLAAQHYMQRRLLEQVDHDTACRETLGGIVQEFTALTQVPHRSRSKEPHFLGKRVSFETTEGS